MYYGRDEPPGHLLTRGVLSMFTRSDHRLDLAGGEVWTSVQRRTEMFDKGKFLDMVESACEHNTTGALYIPTDERVEIIGFYPGQVNMKYKLLDVDGNTWWACSDDVIVDGEES